MPPPQTPQPHHPLIRSALTWTASAFALFATAKLLSLPPHAINVAHLPALLWQDALAAAAFGVLALAVRRTSITVSIYGLACLYVAINVPVARMMSTPLTLPMLRAARGAISDSMGHEFKPINVVLLVSVILAGAVIPSALKRSTRLVATVLSVALVSLLIGPFTFPGTTARHRNALLTLVTSATPRIDTTTARARDDWRTSPFPTSRATDLSHLRGVANGRNVVLILLESHGAQYLGLHGASPDPAPNLSRLAQHAVVFDHAYTTYPESIKSLAATLCSRYPAMDTKPEHYEQGLGPSVAHELSRAGYETALFHSGRFAYLGMESLVNHRGFQTLEDAGHISGNRQSSFGVDEPATVQRMLRWIDSLPKDRPFFLTYMPIAGHHPYHSDSPGPFPDDSDLHHYLNSIHDGDRALGIFFDALRVRGQFDDTLFVLFGDHSEAFGQHDGNFGHTNFIYEENVRVPYLIALPGLVEQTTRATHVASTIDTAPTILDLLGLPIPQIWQGGSLLSGGPRLSLFFTDYSLGLLGLRDGEWKFIHQLESGHSQLFHLRTDTSERTNLAAREVARSDAYRMLLLDWSANQRRRIVIGE